MSLWLEWMLRIIFVTYNGMNLRSKKCVTLTTVMSHTRHSHILIYPTYYPVTNLVGLTDSHRTTKNIYLFVLIHGSVVKTLTFCNLESSDNNPPHA